MAFILQMASGSVTCGLTEELIIDDSCLFRGGDIPENVAPAKLGLYIKKNAKVPDMFFFVDQKYIYVSIKVKNIIESMSMGQCEFHSTVLYRARGAVKFRNAQLGEQIDGDYFIINSIKRLDTINWEHSEAQPEQRWIYKTYTDERAWGTHIIWPAKEGDLLGTPYTGLALRKSLRRGAHIWREHMDNWQFASGIFISNEFKQLIQKEKLGRFEYVPVGEI